MHRLKNAYEGRRAVVIFGGPSLIAQRVDFRRLAGKGAVIFLDAKALTPHFLSFGVEPDYFLMLFPEKCKDNSLQQFIFRSFLAGVNIQPFLKREYLPVLHEMQANFDTYFEPWHPHRGPHKRFRWKPGVYLKDSPFDLLRHLPNTRIIANRQLLAEHFPEMPYPQPLYVFEHTKSAGDFVLEEYYTPIEQPGAVLLRPTGFLNSAAIALYPLLAFMGFREVYLLGMDMTMLGSLEYAALYTFRSMWHFRWFFWRTRHVFNAAYRANRPYYVRPQSEFEDAKRVLNDGRTAFIRVYAPWTYTAPMAGIRTVAPEEFFSTSEER